jgi:peptide subunit release factor 1 (eRF1)
MITRENIVELAQFESPQGCAVSFYFQPDTPQDRSHRAETILVKDLVRNALHDNEKNGRSRGAREDLERVLAMAEHLHGKRRHAKAVFACAQNNFWREYDVPPRLAGTFLTVNKHFHLRPLTAIADVLPRVSIALVGRTTARFFELWMGEIKETEKFVSELPRRSRSDGFAGYNAGHTERHVDHEAMHHFKKFSDHLTRKQEKEGFDRLIVGCRDENWPDIERHLHPYAKQRLIGRFSFDIATATVDQVKEQAERILKEFRERRYHDLFKRVVDEAKANALGALGIKRVLRSLETGEVQTLLLARDFAAPAAECRNCGHVEPLKTGISCPVCAAETRTVEDVSDFLLSSAVRNGIEIVHVLPDPEFEKVGNIAALLRFRADQNTNAALQPAG